MRGEEGRTSSISGLEGWFQTGLSDATRLDKSVLPLYFGFTSEGYWEMPLSMPSIASINCWGMINVGRKIQRKEPYFIHFEPQGRHLWIVGRKLRFIRDDFFSEMSVTRFESWKRTMEAGQT
jgi:hypothetical protein